MKKLFAFVLLTACISLMASAVSQLDDMVAAKALMLNSTLSHSQFKASAANGNDISYLAPIGTFFKAPYKDGTEKYCHLDGFVIPPNVPVTWNPNYKAANTSTYYWNYIDAATNKTMQFVGEQLTVTYPGNLSRLYPAPMMSQNSSMTPFFQLEHNSSLMQAGGALTRGIPNMGIDHLASIYNIDFEKALIPENAVLCMMKNSENTESNVFWTNFHASRYDVDRLEIKGLVEHLAYGGAPYTISKIQLPAQVMATTGGKINLTIYPLLDNDDINFDNPIATSQYVFESDCEFQLLDLDFPFKKIDEFGIERENPVLITESVAVIIDGVYDDPLITEFRPKCIAYLDPYIDNYELNQTGFVLLRAFKGDEQVENLILPNYGGFKWYTDSYKTGVCMPAANALLFNVSYPFVYANLTALQFSIFGGVRTFTIMSDKPFEELSVEAPEWLTIEGANQYAKVNGSQQFAGQIDITATAQASSFQNNGYIVFSTPGSECEIYVYQDDIVGDIDANGDVDGADLNILINILLGKDNAANYDGRANINGDPSGNVTSDDINALINILLGN